MTNKHLLKLVTAATLLIITSTGYSQNVGIGQSAPASKVDVKGNLTVGAGYSGTAAPSNGAIIQGNVGIGTTLPAQTLEIGATTGTIRIDGMISGNSFNTSATSASNLIFVNNTTGDLSALSNGGTGQVLSLSSSGVPTWSTITAATVSGWALTGNAASTAGTNFIGTTNGTDLIFKTNDAENMRLSNSTGNIVIGTGEGGSAVGNIIRAPYNNSGGNKTGADFTIAAGAPTGKGGSGNIIFQELAPNVGSPGNTSDLSIMAEVMRITNTGALSFGSTGTAIGNANNVLISGGSSTNPSWGQLPLNDAVNAVTGTLAAGNGGTGQSTYTVGDMLYASSASLLNKTNAAAAGQVLIGNGTIPTFTTLSGDIGTITSAGAVTVDGLLGKTISPTTLSSTDILEYNGTNWVPTTFPTSLAPSGTAGGDLSGTYPNPTVAKINGVALGTTTATTGNLLIANGTNWVTEPMSGEATITSSGAVTVTGIQGKAISSTAPTTTQVLEYNGTSWVPTALPTSLAPSGTAGGDLSGTYPSPTVAGILGKTISPTTLSSTDILEYNGTNWVPTTFPTSLAPSGTAGGDLSGTYPNPTVAKINGVALGTTTATTGNLLIANGTNWVTEAMSGDASITSLGAVTVKGILGKTISPTTLANTDILEYNGTNWVPTLFPTSLAPSGTAGGDLSGAYPNPTVAKINGVALGTTTATTGNLLIANGTNWVTEAMSGDASITSVGVVTVKGLQGKTISSTAPTTGQVLEYNGTNWTPTTISSSGSSQWTTSGTYIYNNNTGNVGVGTGASTPATQLDVNGDIALRDTAITISSSSSTSTLTPNGYSFVRFKYTGSGTVTITTINGGVNGKILIIYDVNANMKMSSGGNIIGWDTFSTGGVFNTASLIFSASDNEWVLFAAQ